MRCDLVATGAIDHRNRHGHRCARCGREVFSRYENPLHIAMQCVAPAEPKAAPPSRGPGTELKALLAELGITDFAGCGCDTKAARMNRWGVEGCRENFETIRGWIAEAQAKAGWSTTIIAAIAAAKSGVALQINPVDIVGSLVRIAIQRAANHP